MNNAPSNRPMAQWKTFFLRRQRLHEREYHQTFELTDSVMWLVGPVLSLGNWLAVTVKTAIELCSAFSLSDRAYGQEIQTPFLRRDSTHHPSVDPGSQPFRKARPLSLIGCLNFFEPFSPVGLSPNL